MVHFIIHMNTPEGRGHALRSTGSTAWYRAHRWWNGRMRGREGWREGERGRGMNEQIEDRHPAVLENCFLGKKPETTD